MSRIAEQTERFEDMLGYMKQVVNTGNELNVEERNLLSVAYKNSVGSRRYPYLQLELPGEHSLPLNRRRSQRAQRTSNYSRSTRKKSKLNSTSSVRIFYPSSRTKFYSAAALQNRKCSSWRCKGTTTDIFQNMLKTRSTIRRVWRRTQPTRRPPISPRPTSRPLTPSGWD